MTLGLLYEYVISFLYMGGMEVLTFIKKKQYHHPIGGQMLEVQDLLPIGPWLKGRPVFPSEEQYTACNATHSEGGGTIRPEHHSHLTSGVARGPCPNQGLCLRIPSSFLALCL